MILVLHTITPKIVGAEPKTFYGILPGDDRYAYIEWAHEINYDFGIRDHNEDDYRMDTDTWDEENLREATLDDFPEIPLGILAKILHKLSVE